MNANIVYPSVHSGNMTVIRSVFTAELEEEFMRTFVSKYFLPKKLSVARKRQAVKIPVPVETLERLISAVEKARLKGTKSVSVGVATVESLLGELGAAASRDQWKVT